MTEIVVLSQQEAEEVFDAIARREMNISGTEFLRRWDAGYITRASVWMMSRALWRRTWRWGLVR